MPGGPEHRDRAGGWRLGGGDSFDSNRLLRDADLALYRAKSEGRQRVAFCTPALRQEAETLKRRSDALQIAIERQEFTCAYQPQFDTRTGVVRVEALARWPKPDGTWYLPGDFMPIAKGMEALARIDRIILQKAWPTCGPGRRRAMRCRACRSTSPRRGGRGIADHGP